MPLFSICLLAGLAILSSWIAVPPTRIALAPNMPAPITQGSTGRGATGRSPTGQARIVEDRTPQMSEDWYEPQEDHFKSAYHGDTVNLGKQSWNEYWGWVKSFYKGNFIDSGWTKRCKDLVSSVQKSERQIALRRKLNALGRFIAAEWAKTNSGRKVDSSKLLSWGSRLIEAKKKDNGEGEVILKEIELIAKEVGVGI